jgi:HD-GYP domain-containing protein (c-di-GMP phosphodiesterase class II)
MGRTHADGRRLHDLGMIGVRDDILNKLGPLREDDWEIIGVTPTSGLT